MTEIVLAAEAGRFKQQSKKPSYFTGWWASRALHDASLCDEDHEMALAAYSRSFDLQMGVAKGPKNGIIPLFPNGEEVQRRRADAEERRAAELRRQAEAEALADDGALFSLAEVP